MADTKREIERKYDAEAGDTLPDLTRVAGVSGTIDKGVAELDATYYDTPDQRLAAAALTLRRRTGGDDAGWHLKLPVSAGVRDEIRSPLSDEVPAELADLVRSRVREADLVPVVRLLSAREVRHLVDAEGALLAEVSLDRVLAEGLTGPGDTAEWTEIEVELADDGDPAFLDKVEKKLTKAGVKPSASASKLARALTETGAGVGGARPAPEAPVTAGDHVLAYVRTQRDAIVALDPAVRRDAFDSVHSMRVATRRLRSAFRSYGSVLDRTVTDPIGDELKWLAGELGVDRDQEVLAETLTAALADLPEELVRGPVAERVQAWSDARRGGSRKRLIDVLDGPRYLALLDVLDAVVADPPLKKAAGGEPAKVIAKAVRKDFGKLSALVAEALDLPAGPDRDLSLHEARKKAKRTRYAAETAAPALGSPATALVKAAKGLQTLLGDHQDSVLAREALREIALEAETAGESGFTYGVLYGREERRAAEAEWRLPGVWEGIAERTAV